jgi:AraC family transcriptional regulator
MITFDPVSPRLPTYMWSHGEFDSGFRPYVDRIRGEFQLDHHVLIVTLAGGTDRTEVVTDCGHRYSGPETAGAVSFVPAGTRRTLSLEKAAIEWGFLQIAPAMFDGFRTHGPLRPFTNIRDPLLENVVRELARVHGADGLYDAYCDAMTAAIACHLAERHSGSVQPETGGLPGWRLRRVHDHIVAHLADDIRIADLAAVASLSVGHFYRAYRASTNKSPLTAVQEQRVVAATRLLQDGMPVAEVARRVGFASPSHFARVFRRLTGVKPSEAAALRRR